MEVFATEGKNFIDFLEIEYDEAHTVSEELMVKIAAKYDIATLHFVKIGDDWCEEDGEDRYLDESAIGGCDEIWVGIYEDDEIKLASFFHAIGYTLSNNVFDTVYERHQEAWRIGFEVALVEGIEFSDNAKVWAKGKLDTFIGWEENEIGPNWRDNLRDR